MLSNGSKRLRNLKVSGFSVLCLIFLYGFSTAVAQFQNCDYTIELQVGSSSLLSPEYPNFSNSPCRYRLVAPLDHVIKATCNINLSEGPYGCTNEYFYFNYEGDTSLRNSATFCGNKKVSGRSLFRTLVLAYTSNGSFGKFYCSLFVQPQPCDCGWSSSRRISNGQDTSVNEFPSMVSLRNKHSLINNYCGGTIVSHRYILTAAHCARAQPNTEYIEARVGRHNVATSPDTRYSATYSISEIIVHPAYVDHPLNNDIALFKTTRNIEWSRGVGPICLPFSQAGNTFANEYVDALGWGTLFFGGPFSNVLQKVRLLTTNNTFCSDFYKDTDIVYNGQICTYDVTGTKKDSCNFDSGGPIILTRRRQYLVGIISYGRGCGIGGYSIGINTRITSYLQWIHETTQYSTCYKFMYG